MKKKNKARYIAYQTETGKQIDTMNSEKECYAFFMKAKEPVFFVDTHYGDPFTF